jgi:hypothetical protein
MSFVEPSEFDADFVKGIAALKAAGKDVVVGTRSWEESREGSTTLVSPAIAAAAKVGCMVASFDPSAPWALDLIVQHPDSDPLPSLGLLAVAQYRNPGSDLSPALGEIAENLRLRYQKGSPQTGFRKVVAARSEVELTTLRAESVDATVGLQTGSLVGRYMIRLPSDTALAASSVELGKVMSASNEQLKQWFDSMAVVIADLRPGKDPIFETPDDGRAVNGCYGHATGIDALLRDFSIRQARLWHEIALAIISCSIGVIIASRLKRSTKWKVGALIVAAVCIVLVALVAYRSALLLFDPFVYVLGMLFAFVTFISLQRAARSPVA